MGEEARAKGAHLLLGPTVNIQRSPLGGRGFESFSEDPVLAGNAAASVVKGIQSTGVQASIKHFVANDQEHERMAVDSLVTQRALREIYLMPFQIAARDAKPKSFMTAYNKLNGTHVSEDPNIIRKILREEWRWEGLIISDWYVPSVSHLNSYFNALTIDLLVLGTAHTQRRRRSMPVLIWRCPVQHVGVGNC